MDVVKFWATNPGAPIFRAANGSAPAGMLMAYKTATVVEGTMCRCIGALAAESWTAWPYDTFPLGAANACIGADPHLEDPSNLWEDRRGNVHLLTHNNGPFFSLSRVVPVQWQHADPPGAGPRVGRGGGVAGFRALLE